jgi:hypothetical protein
MNYKLLWQLEREENTKLRKKVTVLEASNAIQRELLKEADDIKDTLMRSIERERSDLYARGGIR